MPWEIRPKGSGYQLQNMLTREWKGPLYRDRAKALRYQRALYANDPEAAKEAEKLKGTKYDHFK